MHARSFLLLLAAVGLLAASPSASADEAGFTFFVEPLASPLTPGGEDGTTRAVASFSCDVFDERAAANVTFRLLASPDWATARIGESDVHEATATAADCENGRVEVAADVFVSASHDAPALRAENVTVEAVLDVEGAPPATGTLRVQAAWRGAVNVQPQETSATARPGDIVTFTLDVVNRGNGLARVTFTVDEASGWTLVAPSSVVLGAPADGEEGARSVVTFSIIAPSERGAMEATQAFTLHATPVHPVDATLRGETQSVTVEVQRGGSAMPLGGMWLVIVALVGALVILRARR